MKRSSKTPNDPNTLAAFIVKAATEEATTPDAPAKNPHAVALGRLGGLKGGKARAAKLSAAKRKRIAKKAAGVRWSREK